MKCFNHWPQRAWPVTLHVRAEYKVRGLINELCRCSVAPGSLSINCNTPLEPDWLCLPVLVCAFVVAGAFVCLTVATALWQNVLFADALSVHVFVSTAD